MQDSFHHTAPKSRTSLGAMSAGEFAVSAAAAGMAHVLHHPLYTLKSQMMYYGPTFSFRNFLGNAWKHPVDFLYKGKIKIIAFLSLTHLVVLVIHI